MNPSSSSISSSDLRGPGLRVTSRFLRTAPILAWTVVFLVAIDLTVAQVLPVVIGGSKTGLLIRLCREYGRSIKGKLQARIVDIPPITGGKHPGANVFPGFPEVACDEAIPAPPDKIGVSVYGMSFSNHVAEELPRLDPKIHATTYWAAWAGPSFAYTCFVKEKEKKSRIRNPVQIFGILASSVKANLAMIGGTYNVEYPPGYTYPRYYLDDDKGGLRRVDPTLNQPMELIDALTKDEARWDEFERGLAENDRFYNRLTMHGNALTDGSFLLRMLRRAFSQKVIRDVSETVVDGKGFKHNPEIEPVLKSMVDNFSRRCRADGQLPIVLLLQDKGSKNALDVLLAEHLRREQIPYVSTVDVFDSSDHRNFQPDGHFSEEANRKLSKEVLKRIREGLAQKPKDVPGAR